MSVPNLFSIVEAVFARGEHILTTKEGAGRFTEAVALALHAKDKRFGHLAKPANRTHVIGPDGRRHAVDVVLFRDGNRYATVDLIIDAGGEHARIGWGVEESDYTEDDWYAPISEEPEPDPPPEPFPLAALLKYLDETRAELRAELQHLKQEMAALRKQEHVGTVRVPYLGTGAIELKPK